MNQRKLEANSCKRHKTRENAFRASLVWFWYYLFREWCESNSTSHRDSHSGALDEEKRKEIAEQSESSAVWGIERITLWGWNEKCSTQSKSGLHCSILRASLHAVLRQYHVSAPQKCCRNIPEEAECWSSVWDRRTLELRGKKENVKFHFLQKLASSSLSNGYIKFFRLNFLREYE